MQVIAQMASIYGREKSMQLAVQSLYYQVDHLWVMLNNYPSIPEWSKLYPNVTFVMRNNEKGDAEKFYQIDRYKCYLLTTDDDLIYPNNYARVMLKAIQKYDGAAIVSFHGRKLKPGRIDSYYSSSSREAAYRCLGAVEGDHLVSSGGTGVMGWDGRKVTISYDWFKEKNMADVWVAVEARKRNIPIIVAEHKQGWILSGYDGPGIWDEHFSNDDLQTKIWNGEYEG